MSVTMPSARRSEGDQGAGAEMTETSIIVVNETDMPCGTSDLEDLARFLLVELRLHEEAELGIRLVGLDEMTELHVEWMQEAGPTDVLSFPMDELRSAPPGTDPVLGMLGDIVLCPQVAAAQAIEFGRSLDEELQYLTTHGVLHLIGYDHMTEGEHAEMFTLKDQLLERWNGTRQVSR